MKLFYSILLLSLLVACTTEAPVRAVISEPVVEGNAAVIRLPVPSRSEPTDTNLVAKLVVDEPEYMFGSIRSGRSVRHSFTFTNEGLVPLLITNARSSCGCTVADYPEEPIAPGEKGRISVVFDTAGKLGRQRKPIVLTANTYPAATTLYLSGEVTE